MEPEAIKELELKEGSIVLIGLTRSVRKWVVGLFDEIDRDGKMHLRTHMIYQMGTFGAFTGDEFDLNDIFTVEIVAEPSEDNMHIFEHCIAPLNYTIVGLLKRLRKIRGAVETISTSDKFDDDE
jgi:hypothetical protein